MIQTCSEAIPVIDAECWRLAWNIKKGITGMAGMPTLKSGRIHQSDPDIKWLKEIKPGLVETVKRMLSLIGENGMPAGVRVGNLI